MSIKRHRKALVLLGTALLVTACGSAATSAPSKSATSAANLGLIKPGEIQVATSTSIPPMTFAQNGKETGMGIEIVNDIARQLHLKVVYTDVSDFDSFLAAVQAGTYDLGAEFTFITPQQAAIVGLSEPWLVANYSLVELKSSGLSVSDLCHTVIGLEPGTSQYTYVTSHCPNDSSIKLFQTNATNYAALEAGSIKMVMGNSATLPPILKEYPNFKVIGTPTGASSPGAFAFPKKDKAFIAAFNSQLNKLFNNGTWLKLYREWFPGFAVPTLLITEHPALKQQLS